MTQIEIVQTLAKIHPVIWRRATKDQRRQIVSRYEETGDADKAFAGIRAYRVELSDLTFDTCGAMRVGGGR